MPVIRDLTTPAGCHKFYTAMGHVFDDIVVEDNFADNNADRCIRAVSIIRGVRDTAGQDASLRIVGKRLQDCDIELLDFDNPEAEFWSIETQAEDGLWYVEKDLRDSRVAKVVRSMVE